jgi:hypothetical protein
MRIPAFLSRAIPVLITAVMFLPLSAQRNCGSMDYLQQQIEADPERAARLQSVDQHAYQFEVEHGHEDRAVVTIPVVFHVVWRTTAENVSDAKLLAQLQQINDDFARLNSDAGQTPSLFASLGADTEIRFCLAQRDPSGNPTTGIVRRQTTVTAFSSNDAVKYTANGGSNAWPRDSYLNIWVANLSGGLLGYAQFPGGAAATDGVVVLYSSVGSIASPGSGAPFNMGRTATHEVGHWLNLRHIWGDATCGNDQVSDTPVHNTSNGGCPTYPHYSTCTGSPVEMTMNYMDYTDDGCMNIFTLGQKTRMQALFGTGGSRVSLLSSLGCVPPSGGTTCAVPSGLAASNITTSSATVSWGAVSGAASYDLQYKLSSSSTWTTVNTTATSFGLSGLSSATTYNYQVRANCSGGSSAYSAAGSFTTQSAGGCPDALEPNNSTTAPASVTLPLSLSAIIASSTDADYYAFTTSGTNNLSISLGNLAADYDLRLLNSAGTQLAASQNTGTTGETISLANASSGTYFIHVFGYNGAFNASQCYALTASATPVVTNCDTWESNNTTGTAKVIAVNTNIQAAIGSSSDVDWFRFNNTSSQRRIRIDLTNLPADYDVRLYRGTSTQVGISQNSGTTNEVIILNTSTVTTYYVRVNGYNGAFNASQCYTLRASISGTNFREGEVEQEELMLEPATGLMSLFPNPANDKVSIEYASPVDAQLDLMVFDGMGRMVFNTVQPVQQGTTLFTLPVERLDAGVYLLQVADGDRRETVRFIVER